MTASLHSALLSISNTAAGCSIKTKDTGPSAVMPRQSLYQEVPRFVDAWKRWRQSQASGVIENPSVSLANQQCVDTFFAKMQELCLKYGYYSSDKKSHQMADLIHAIGLYIPWEFLPENIRWHRLSVIFSQQEFRQQFWQFHLTVTHREVDHDFSYGINPSVLTAMLSHDDVRASFLAQPANKILPAIKKLKLAEHIPSLFGELSDEKKQAFLAAYPEAAKSIFLKLNSSDPREMSQLLKEESVRRFLLANRDVLTRLVKDNLTRDQTGLDAYLCSLFSLIAKNSRDIAFEDALASVVLDLTQQAGSAQLPLMPGMYLLVQEREKATAAVGSPVEVAGLQNLVQDLIKSTYDRYFHDPTTENANSALQILRPLTNKTNTDAVARAQANYYLARIYMNTHQVHFALPRLKALRNADGELTDYLTEDQKAEVLDYEMLCRAKLDANFDLMEHVATIPSEKDKGYYGQFFLPVHRESKAVVAQPKVKKADEDITKPIVDLLTRLNRDLGVYLSERDTSGILYTLRIKNVALSDQKNKMVRELRNDLSHSINELSDAGCDIDMSSVLDALEARLMDALNLNSQFYASSKRFIDGEGTLGSDLEKALESLRNFGAHAKALGTPS